MSRFAIGVGQEPALQVGASALEGLFTESIVVSGISATSFAWNPRTSRKTRTAT